MKGGDRAIRKRAASSGAVITPNQSRFLKNNIDTNQKRSNSISGLHDMSHLDNVDETTAGSVAEQFDKEKHMESLNVNIVRNSHEMQSTKNAWGKNTNSPRSHRKSNGLHGKKKKRSSRSYLNTSSVLRDARQDLKVLNFSSASDIEYNSGSDGFSSDASTGSRSSRSSRGTPRNSLVEIKSASMGIPVLSLNKAPHWYHQSRPQSPNLRQSMLFSSDEELNSSASSINSENVTFASFHRSSTELAPLSHRSDIDNMDYLASSTEDEDFSAPLSSFRRGTPSYNHYNLKKQHPGVAIKLPVIPWAKKRLIRRLILRTKAILINHHQRMVKYFQTCVL